jgi:LmbE family N-acetylglucosaminyl deacetylase
MPNRVLALVPHPDDAEFHAGGLLAMLAQQGMKVNIVVATDGSKGSYELEPDRLISVRRDEALQAARVLGAEPPVFLGHTDMELERLPPGSLREQFVRAIRQYRPDILVSQDPFGDDLIHPDHRATALAAAEAVAYAGLPLLHPEQLAEGLLPHVVAEKYYFTEDLSRVNKIVDISQTLAVKLAAMAEHKSQVAFLMQGLLKEVELAGIPLEALSSGGQLDLPALMSAGLTSQAAEIGRRLGYTYGEAYHYVRFYPAVESLLQAG